MKFRLFTGAIAIITSVAALAADGDAFEYNGYRYTVISEDDATAMVSSNQQKYSGDIVIPENVVYNDKTYTVVEVAGNSFNANYYATSVTLPATVKKIGNGAFAYSPKYTKIVAPGLEEVGDNTFASCNGLVEVDFPELKKTGNNAFYNMSNLVSVKLPKLAELGTLVFYNDRKLASVVLSDNLVSLPDNTFGNSAITSFAVPASCKTLGRAPFGGCAQLAEVTLAEGVETLGDRVFAGTAITSVVIPGSMKAIGSDTFNGCTKLTSAAFPESMTELPDGTFTGCTSLTGVTNLPSGITAIGSNAFQNCSALRTVVFPDAVTTIGAGAFSGCDALESLTIGRNLTDIDVTAFKGLKALKSLDVAAGNTSYSSIDGALYNADGSVLVLFPCANAADNGKFVSPASLREVSAEAFYRSNAVSSVTFGEGLTRLGYKAFNESGIEAVTLPASLEEWGENVFDNASTLKSVTISKGLTKVPAMSFYKCVALEEIIVPEGFVTIDKDAFSGCTGLKTITLPSTLESIESGGFDKCSSATEIHVLAELDPICAPYALDGISRTECTVYVPKGAVNTYRQADTWKEFENIVEEPSVGIADINDDNSEMMVSVADGEISVNAPDGINIAVYTVTGQLVYNNAGPSARVKVQPGNYLVTAGSKTLKIYVR